MQEKNVNNYVIQAQAARALFLKWNQKELTKRPGIDVDENFIFVRFLEKQYSIDRHTGEVLLDGTSEPVDYNAVMVIYDLLCNSKPGATLSGQWKTKENLSSGSNFASLDGSLFGPAAKFFSGKLPQLRDACAKVGGFDTKKADVGFMFNVFPFLPLIFQFWDGDDEFDPRISFLFDSNTLDFVCFESAWYIAGHLLELIRQEMDAMFDLGFYGR